MERFDYLIVGAGFAGSVCAERLASVGKTVLLIDQRAHIGGNAYDEYNEHGILVHKYGPHIFHSNSKDVVDYLSRFTAWRPYEHRVLADLGGGLQVPVPINRTTLAAFNDDEQAAKDAIYRPYTRKQWGCEPEDLDPTVLARVKARDSDDDRYFTDTYQCMPTDGYTRLFQRMLASPNIKILLKTHYRDVLSSGFNYLNGLLGQIDGVIYSGPIDEFFDYRLGRLPYRSATFAHESFPRRQAQSAAVVNYPDARVPYTRVTEFKQLTGQFHPYTTLAYETPCADGEPYWPVPTAASAILAKGYRELAAQRAPLVSFLGRLGTFQYYNIDQVVAQALTLCRRLIEQRRCA